MRLTFGVFWVDWDLKLQQTMVEMFPLKSADAAYSKISGMLATLGDPFTRIISPKVIHFTNNFVSRLAFRGVGSVQKPLASKRVDAKESHS